MGMINLTFVLKSPKGRCCGNQVILVLFANVETDTSVFAVAFRNGMQYRLLHNGIITSYYAAIFCKKLVNFGAVTSEIAFLICIPSCGYWAKIGLRSPFVALACSNVLDD